MTKASVAIVITAVIISLGINSSAKQTVKQKYQEGVRVGEKAGYSEIEAAYKEKFQEQDIFYKQKIAELQSIYDKKIKSARENGYLQGQKDKQKEVEENLQKTTVEKEKAGKWNDVLFDVNN